MNDHALPVWCCQQLVIWFQVFWVNDEETNRAWKWHRKQPNWWGRIRHFRILRRRLSAIWICPNLRMKYIKTILASNFSEISAKWLTFCWNSAVHTAITLLSRKQRIKAQKLSMTNLVRCFSSLANCRRIRAWNDFDDENGQFQSFASG